MSATEIVMPRLSDSMEEGTILSWRKAVGEEVAVGDELVEIETDKANMVYESDASGRLLELLAVEGDTLPVGEVIALIGAPGEPVAGTPAAPAERAVSRQVEPTPPSRLKISPLARRIAREAALDPAGVVGTGPGGRIVKRDVETVIGSQPASRPSVTPGTATESAKGSVERIELSRLQQTVARRMAESKATAPHFYLQATIDMSRVTEARARLKAIGREDEPVPSINDLVVKACGLALRDFPLANAAYVDGAIERYSRANVGIAVSAAEALVVPTIFDADRKGLHQIAAEARTLATKVREGKITPPELAGGTFTVSNLGMYGIDGFQAVVNRGQAAILAVGAVKEVPVAREGSLTISKQMQVSLSCDHRVLYGADGAQFLARVSLLLEEPLGLAL